MPRTELTERLGREIEKLKVMQREIERVVGRITLLQELIAQAPTEGQGEEDVGPDADRLRDPS